MNKNKIPAYIDRLLAEGKDDEAIPFIEEVWQKRAQEEQEMIDDISRKLAVLEKLREPMAKLTDE